MPAIYCTKFEIFCNIYDMTAIQFYSLSNFAIYCKIIAIYIARYQPLCRKILQTVFRAICDILKYTAIYCNTIYCSLCIFYIDWRFIFGSVARVERLFSHCKYIKTETRNRLTTKHFEDIIFLKSNRDLWENSQQLISRVISQTKKKKNTTQHNIT